MILVTGGTGLAGASAVRELLRRGQPVAVLGRDADKIERRFPGQNVEARQGDVRNTDSLHAAFKGVDAVIDAVQFPNSPIENKRKGWTFEEIDYKGTLNQILAAKAAGVQRYVYVSAVGASTTAEKHWFVFKGLAEKAVRSSGITHVIVRPSWLFGPEDVALNRFVGFARRLRFVPLFGNGQQLMQPLFIDDLGRVLVDALDKGDNGTFELGGPERLTMDETIKAALEIAGKKRPILHQPVAVGKLAASFLRFLPGPPLTPDAIDFIANEAVADNTDVERVFAPKLTSLRDGLSTYLP